ncbi:Ig-like domain-containing protein [Pontiellaceae bacterium B12227]|nr:Ig-like domain-containing protein [Pontiellaceae bacterium B12227]
MIKLSTLFIFSTALLLPQLSESAETTAAYIPFSTAPSAQTVADTMPPMGTDYSNKLERMTFFMNGNFTYPLRDIHDYATGNRSRAFQLSHPLRIHSHSTYDVSWADSNVVNKYTKEEVASWAPLHTPGIKTPNPRTKLVNWTWDPDDPNVIRDVTSGEAFPNATYPENQTGYGVSAQGEVTSVTYWEDPAYAASPYTVYCTDDTSKPDQNIFNGRYYFTGMRDYLRSEWLMTAMGPLSRAYLESGNEIYAEYVRDILVAYAANYNSMFGVREHISSKGRMGSYVFDPMLNHIGSPMKLLQRFHRDTGYHVGIDRLNELMDIYDRVYSADAFNETVPGEGISARDFIEQNFIEPMFDLSWDTRPDKEGVVGNIADYAFDTCHAALVMGKPDWARMCNDFVEINLTQSIASWDMITLESPGYHINWAGNVSRAAHLMNYYEDPPGYTDADGVHLKGKDYRLTENFKRMFTSPDVFRYPDGRNIAVHDAANREPTTVKNIGWPDYSAGVIEKSRNRIAPGFGHTSLGDGENDRQIQAHLHWSGGGSHTHNDNLTIGLFAFGRELYGDPGYSWADYARAPYGHNTVFINGTSPYVDEGRIGNNLFHAPTLPGLAVSRIEHTQDYRFSVSSVDRYRRTQALNTTDLDHPYVIDLFEVFGGNKHEFFLQGSMRDRMQAASNLSAGEKQSYTTGTSYYSLLSNMEVGDVRSNTTVTMTYTDDAQQGVKIHVAHDASDNMELILGDGPVYYDTSTPSSGESGISTPKMILRRDGSNLKTVFALVHEPFTGGATSIQSVDKTIVESNGVPVELALTITFTDGRIDHHLFSLDGTDEVNIEDQRSMSTGPLSANASYAAAITDGADCDLYLVGGTSANCGTKSLSVPEAVVTGSLLDTHRAILGAEEDGYISDINLPLGERLDREMIYIDFLNPDGSVDFVDSFEIKRVDAHSNGVFIAIHQDAVVDYDPADGLYKQYAVNESFREAAQVRVRYMPSASTVPVAHITPNQGRWEREMPSELLPVHTEDIEINTRYSNGTVRIGIDALPAGTATNQHIVSTSQVAASAAGTTVQAQAENSGGVMVSPLITQGFRNILPMQAAGTTYPGLFCSYSQGGGSVLPDIRVPELGLSDSNDYVYEGFIEVPASGTYSFRYSGKDVVLKINGIEIANSLTDETRIPWAVQTSLEAGLHAFEMSLTWNDTDQDSMRNISTFFLDWKLPGSNDFARVPSEAFSHTAVGAIPSVTLQATQNPTNTLAFTFSVASSDDGLGSPIPASNIGWDLDGDGRIDFTGVSSLNHTYPVIGTYSVEVIAVNSDGERATDTAMVDAGSAQPNQPPVASNLVVSVTENGSTNITLTGSDPEGSNLFYHLVEDPAHGTLSGTLPLLTYTPISNYSGADSFTYTVSDGQTNSAEATVSITVAALPEVAGIVSIGSASPSGGSNILAGAEGSETRSREVIRTDSQQFVVGQSFQLEALHPGQTYELSELYLKSRTAEDFDEYSDLLQIKVFTNTQAGATLLGTWSFDLATLGDGTGANEVAAYEWVRFSLGDGLTLDAGGTYSFLMFFDGSSGPNDINKWGFMRDDSGIYAEGNQWEGRNTASPAYVASDWTSNPWNNVLADSNDDFMFYIGGSVVAGDIDTDGDGLTDAQELALGTDPNDSNSTFGIDGTPLPMSGNIQLTWPSATGVLYRIWESPDLVGWTVTRDWTHALTPPEDTIEVTLTPSNGFFKVEAEIE